MQSQLRTWLLFAAVVIAVWVCGVFAWGYNVVLHNPPGYLHFWDGFLNLILSSPLWMPIVFVAFAIGRKRPTTWTIVILILAELAMMAVVYIVFNNLHHAG